MGLALACNLFLSAKCFRDLKPEHALILPIVVRYSVCMYVCIYHKGQPYKFLNDYMSQKYSGMAFKGEIFFSFSFFKLYAFACESLEEVKM